MTTVSTTLISTLYKSRVTILELLKEQDYDVDDYENFSINDIHAMCIYNRMDMMISSKSKIVDTDIPSRIVYVKYVKYQSGEKYNAKELEAVLEDLYEVEEVLKEKDTLIYIIPEEPNDTLHAKMKYLFDKKRRHVVAINIQRLQFNVLNHNLVPKHVILSTNEVQELANTFKFKDTSYRELIEKLPEISRFDPIALAIFMRPGQVCRIERDSITSITSNYYRVCV